MPDLVTAHIIREASNGNHAAFRTIVEQHQAFVYAVAFRFVNDSVDAEDLTQEIFIRLWKSLHTYRDDVKFTTWLYRIVANRCLDFLKSSHGRNRKNKVDVTSGHFVQDHSTPEKELQQNELMQVIQKAAGELTPKQKAVFILRDLEGLSSEEVSEALKMPVGNVKSNLFYARQKMSEKIKAFYHTTDKQIYDGLQGN
jgi:RNA polymerase sigma-70 factor, ECF subfamily